MALVVAAFLILPVTATAQPDLANVSAPIPAIDGRGTANGGYDVVAYFDYGEATVGSPEIFLDYQNTYRFRFASKVTMKKFMGDPERYLPAYGGYCALSLGAEHGEFEGRKAGLYKAEPTVYQIVGDRLFLFSSPEALEVWQKNQDAYITRADANWEAILSSRPAVQ